MRYVVIGGAGAMGRITVRDLVQFAEPADEIVIADYDLARASVLARQFEDSRVTAISLDVRDIPSTAKSLSGAFAVINCVQHHFNLDVMRAAIQARTHYLDLGGLFHMTLKQLPLDSEFRRIAKLAVLGMGAAPGITNLLARMGAELLGDVREIHCRVASIDKTKYRNSPALPVSYSLQTILEEFSTEPAVFTKGKLEFVEPMSGFERMRFPAPLGLQQPMYTIHSEVATLPKSFPGVREVSFKIAFDPVFLERVKFLRDFGFASQEPISVGGAKIKPIEVVNKVAMSQKPGEQVGPVRHYEIIRTIVKGRRQTITLDCHCKNIPDVNTGAPPAIVARMIAAGEITGSGVHPPENIIPGKAFFAHLAKRRMRVRINK
ncbi:MAG TPA: saccharopine dehydrogenase NADP-binding domain-containing protein [Verrucomicrobiae bacterium]|nr:saccharopine dehydrogenase NADP-binding domain-containing protein [Verrucomicrobiae bacterium]